jgi:hypothetical protein
VPQDYACPARQRIDGGKQAWGVQGIWRVLVGHQQQRRQRWPPEITATGTVGAAERAGATC